MRVSYHEKCTGRKGWKRLGKASDLNTKEEKGEDEGDVYRLYIVCIIIINKPTEFRNQYPVEIFKFRIYLGEKCLEVMMSLNPDIQTYSEIIHPSYSD